MKTAYTVNRSSEKGCFAETVETFGRKRDALAFMRKLARENKHTLRVSAKNSAAYNDALGWDFSVYETLGGSLVDAVGPFGG